MMMEHNDLAREMQHIDKLPVTERIALAKKRRKQQIATYTKWAKTDNYNNRKSKSSTRKSIRFSSEVQLLETAARAATDKGAIDEMRTVLKSGVNPNQMNHDGLTALHQACIDGSLEMVNLLLKAGADVNVVDRDLWTPLHAAATCGHFKIVTTLIRAGANLIAINGDGDLPYDITEDEVTQHYLENEMTKRGITQEFITKARHATHDKMKDDIQYLLRNGDDINQPLDQGGTLLHTAIANGFNDLMEILLENGADSTAKDEDGWEPIHVAAYWCNDSALEALAEKKMVNLRSLTDKGETPYDLCDDPELKIHILQMISDRPNEYKFHEAVSESCALTTEATSEVISEKSTIEDNEESTTENETLYPEEIYSIGKEKKENARKQSSDEELPLNPLLNLQATELSERRNSVKEAKHMAPMKRMNSIEHGNVSKISPYATQAGQWSTNEKDKTISDGMPDKQSDEPLLKKTQQFNHLQTNTSSISRQQEELEKKIEDSHLYKDTSSPSQNNHRKQPTNNSNLSLSNNSDSEQTMPAHSFQNQEENVRGRNPKNFVYIPRKKNAAPQLPPGSLLHLKRQRQEARALMIKPEEAEQKSSSNTFHMQSQFYDIPPSPTMIRYSYKMMHEDVVGEAFIKEKKCAIM